MILSGLTGDEIYCLALHGYEPGALVVGNSVASMGVGGAIGTFGRALAGGELTEVTALISEGRHRAIGRMEAEAARHGAAGVTGVDAALGQLGGFTEFLAQGTAVHGPVLPGGPFSTAATGGALYCHLDAGYAPRRFVMGTVAFALGVGRGLSGSLRTLGRGEVPEFTNLIDEVRRTAIGRLRQEAAAVGANAVVDVHIRLIPFGPGTLELLLTGTASHHPRLSPGQVSADGVVTSELAGTELWNLAKLDLVPHQLVTGTSICSLGASAGLSTMWQALTRGELPEVTRVVQEARERALDRVRREAEALGAERVIGNRLEIREIAAGVVEVVAVGTAVVRRGDMPTRTAQLIPQVLTASASGRRDAAEVTASSVLAQPVARTREVAATGVEGLAILILLAVAALVAGTGTLFMMLSAR